MAAETAPCPREDAGERLYQEALDWYWGLAAHCVSDTLAVEAFREAAALDHPAALLQMGAFYKCGRLTGRDAEKAEDCFDRAASAGSWFTSRAESGDPLAMWQLSRAIAHGIVAGDTASTAGVPCPVLPAEALRVWETLPATGREADAAIPEAETDARVKVRALYWCWRAASCGYALAQFDLSQCYHQGEGVPRDAEAAAKWCRLAADAGMTEGAYVLGCYHAEGSGVKQSDAESSAWLRRAAACGHIAGQRLLSLMHKRGGCERASSKWLRNARDSSSKPAAVTQQQQQSPAPAVPPPPLSSAPSQAAQQQQRQSDARTPAPASSPQSGGTRSALSGPTPPRAHAGRRRPSMLRRSAELAQSAAALMHSR